MVQAVAVRAEWFQQMHVDQALQRGLGRVEVETGQGGGQVAVEVGAGVQAE
jgi:hypothetical protein